MNVISMKLNLHFSRLVFIFLTIYSRQIDTATETKNLLTNLCESFCVLKLLKIFMTIGCRELLLLSMTVSMGMLIFAGLGYALEKDEPDTMFYTLPQVGKMLKPSSIQSH